MAIMNVQTILMVITAAILNRVVPPSMQLVGLVLGLLGALLLTIPKELYGLYYRVTRCRRPPLPEPPATYTEVKLSETRGSKAGERL